MKFNVDFFSKLTDKKVAIYGLGTETERAILNWGKDCNIVGLLDGFRTGGEIYGYPIITMDEAISKNVETIIVVARPGSCKAIAKRIGNICRDNEIELIDIRGKNLLEETIVRYDLSKLKMSTKDQLLKRIADSDVVSFDLFDTLVTRRSFVYTDIFELIECRNLDGQYNIADFSKYRLQAEKELSRMSAPKLEEIYRSFVSNVDYTALADQEYETDLSLIVPRKEMCSIFKEAVHSGKKVVITTDTYYSRDRIEKILTKCGIHGYAALFISCEEGVSKSQGLYNIIKNAYKDKNILHIGDDEYSDVECASRVGIDNYKIYNSNGFMDACGGLGIDLDNCSVFNRLKAGTFVARIFNNPFIIDESDKRIAVNNSRDIGYLFYAPMIMDFCFWLRDKVIKQGYEQVLFCARDGYLIKKLFDRIYNPDKSFYFLTSRTAAIRAGMITEDDFDYVNSMKYFGNNTEAIFTRFGIRMTENADEADKKRMILEKAEVQRKNYGKYIDNLDLTDEKITMFDFVAKGTTQMYLQRLFNQPLKGFYFLQLEPEFMKDKGLDIEPFYSEEEKDSSAIFDNYYLLETVLTSLSPQLMEFGMNGNPVFAEETRTSENLRCIEEMQAGIIEYFDDMLPLIGENYTNISKKLDEELLNMINKLDIRDDGFLALKVEDPFFGRMTNVSDLLG